MNKLELIFPDVQEQEKKVLRKIENISGYLFIDIGAFYGEYCINLSSRFKEIWAFEPASDSRNKLLLNITKYNIGNIKVFSYAISEKIGKARLYRSPKEPGMTGLFQSYQRFDEKEALTLDLGEVETKTLEYIVGSRIVELLKIDVEGKEIDILKGGIKVLPQIERIVIELHNESRLKELEDILRPFGFNKFERICECRYYIEK